jgi:uncharacterized protein YndB with AHSA1/START domain
MKTGMLIRRRAGEVFEAFVNPDITTKFWFTKGSGRLEVGKQVEWAWEMYNISVPVTAKVIEPNTRIVIEWKGYGVRTTVEWMFITEKATELGRHLVEIDPVAMDDEQARAAADLRGRDAPERLALSAAPVRREIARRHDHQQRRCASERLLDLRWERRVARELRIEPDP